MPNKARQAALYAVERCRRDGAWNTMTMDAAVKKFDLDKRDAGFTARLSKSVMENESLLDYYVDLYSSTPARRLEPKVLNILRMSICQLLYMDKVPSHAAVNEGVELCREAGMGRAAGLVNAVLHRIAENKDKLPDVPGAGTAEYLAVKYSHPLWLAEKLMAERGYDFAKSCFEADNTPAPLYIQVNTLKTTASELSGLFDTQGVKYEPLSWLDNCLCIENPGSIETLPGFADGLFYVQDPAARASASVAGLEFGMSVLDVCAAPGGKSFAAAIEMQNNGSILSCDIHEKKAGLIVDGAKRLGISIISTQARDAKTPFDGLFDAVIADVPCSGMGVIRKKPEIRYKKLNTIAGLPDIQKEILNSAAKSVKPGGVLLYSTCTFVREENQGVVEAFLGEHPDFRPEGFNIHGAASDGMYTFWPHIDGTDGFFVCKLRKNN